MKTFPLISLFLFLVLEHEVEGGVLGEYLY